MSGDLEFVDYLEARAAIEAGAGNGGDGVDFLVRIGGIFVVIAGALAIMGMILLRTIENIGKAKAEHAWARAAQLDAQANLVDARTAQIGTVAAGMFPYLVIALCFLAVAAAVVAVILYMDGRAKERHTLQLQYGTTELWIPGEPIRFGENGRNARIPYRPVQTAVRTEDVGSYQRSGDADSPKLQVRHSD